ncbi:MAG: hypothetical protein HY296_04420 [Thaumarchaeota archaeon]|nr:hypothetical protein [Nitrososphaerota archaeon]
MKRATVAGILLVIVLVSDAALVFLVTRPSPGPGQSSSSQSSQRSITNSSVPLSISLAQPRFKLQDYGVLNVTDLVAVTNGLTIPISIDTIRITLQNVTQADGTSIGPLPCGCTTSSIAVNQQISGDQTVTLEAFFPGIPESAEVFHGAMTVVTSSGASYTMAFVWLR